MWDSISNGGGGSWQEYVSVKEDMLTRVPESIPDEVASQFIINPWTVYGMLKDLAVPRGEYILQTAAGSVLGR
jgi:NADPH:quinone reductase-like Zn-dependent oxidoreductase